MITTKSRSYVSFWSPVVKFYPTGVLQTRYNFTPQQRSEKQKSSRRGDITSFSRHSALRLRKALLSLSLPDNLRCRMVGLTLTLPWQVTPDLDWEGVYNDYKAVFNRFGVSFNRKFPNSSAIFRHELQSRKMPHCHMVFWLSDFDFHLRSRGRSANLDDLRAIVHSLWSRALFVDSLADKYSFSLSGFSGFGVKAECLSDSVAAVRYICDHTSKHKQSQLGYRGKQWGFLRRKMFVPVDPFVYEFNSDDDLVCFNRHISKVCRYRVEGKLSRRCCNKSVLFIASTTVKRVVDALLFDRLICKTFDQDNYFFQNLEASRLLWASLGFRLYGPSSFCFSLTSLSAGEVFQIIRLLVLYT